VFPQLVGHRRDHAVGGRFSSGMGDTCIVLLRDKERNGDNQIPEFRTIVEVFVAAPQADSP
jgi:hypothetical protein